MISISESARQLLEENQTTRFKATIKLANNTTLNITGVDVMSDSVSFKDSCSSSSVFSVGAAIINSLSFTLNNFEGKFNNYDFTNATITAYIGIPLSTIEWVQKGVYTVEKPTSVGDTIPLICIDNMSKFEKPLKNVNYGAYKKNAITVGNALYKICSYCGVLASSYSFTNSDKVINLDIEDGNMSCLDAISYLAQLSGYYARMTRFGYLSFSWYDKAIWSNVSNLDGGDFDYENTGNVVDGGNFSYGTQNVIDGGTFSYGDFISLYAFSDFNIATEDITITGVRIMASDNETEVSSGNDGYVISISDNPLITKDNVNDICTTLGSKIIGLKFRPFNVTSLSNVTAEAGDPVRIVDKNGHLYYSYITTCTFNFGNYENFACNAETVSENNATDFSALTKAVAQARSETEKQLTQYDKAVQAMNMLASNMMGCYFAYDTDTNGGVICYSSNKPFTYDTDGNVTGCQVGSSVWKRNSSGYFICSNATTTKLNNLAYVAGIDNSGNITAMVISTLGLNADWINTGNLTVGGNATKKVGTIYIKDANNKNLVWFDNSGMHLESGQKIAWDNITPDSNLAYQSDIPDDLSDLGGSITSTQISDNAVTTAKINANAVTTKKLATDAIKSSNYSYSSGDYSTAGTYFNLENGAITSKNFAIDKDGNAKFKGDITGASGTFGGQLSGNTGSIGGFTIDSNQLSTGDAVVKKDAIGCGVAGKGIVQMIGNNDGNNSKYGYIQIANDGNLAKGTCINGIRIYGNGLIRTYDANGTEKDLGNLTDLFK